MGRVTLVSFASDLVGAVDVAVAVLEVFVWVVNHAELAGVVDEEAVVAVVSSLF